MAGVNSKHAFWQALVVTIAIFIIGLFLGVALENKRADKANERFIESEIALMDSFTLGKISKISEDNDFDCEVLVNSNIQFANKIYDEARVFENYGESEKLTQNVKQVLKRYDLLRTLLWVNTMEIPRDCMNETSVIVYVFDRDDRSLEAESEKNVWERILLELRKSEDKKIILIPIGLNEELISLNTILSGFDSLETPAVIIDNKHVISEPVSVNELKSLLK